MIAVWSVIGIVLFLVLLWVVYTTRLFTRTKPVYGFESFVRWKLFSKFGLHCMSAAMAGAGLGAFYYGVYWLMIACGVAAYVLRLWRVSAPKTYTNIYNIEFGSDEAIGKSLLSLILLLAGTLCLHFAFEQTWVNSIFAALNGMLILMFVFSLLLFGLLENLRSWARSWRLEHHLRRARKNAALEEDEDFDV